jgi:hypothetical protein
MSGRVSKPRTKAGVTSYAEDDDEVEMAVKPEDDNGTLPPAKFLPPFLEVCY